MKHRNYRQLLLLPFFFSLANCANIANNNDKATPPDQNPYLAGQPEMLPESKHLFDLAMQAMQDEQWDSAKTYLTQLIDADPKLSGAILNLGIVATKQQKTELAEQYFKQAIDTNKNNLEAYNQLGVLYRSQGKFTLAEETYQQGLTIWDQYGPLHYNLGILYDLYMNRPSDALRHYKAFQALQKQPDKRVALWIKTLERKQ